MIDDSERIARAERILRGEQGEGARRPAPMPINPSWSDERRAVEAEIQRRESLLYDGHPDLALVPFMGGKATRIAVELLTKSPREEKEREALRTKSMTPAPTPTPAPQRRLAISSKEAICEIAAAEKLSTAQADDIFEKLKSLQQVPLEVALGVVATAFMVVRNAFEDRIDLDVSILDTFERRLAELERSPLAYDGPYESSKSYSKGIFVTHDGSLWHCNYTTASKPGDGPAWTLAVKRGRDGR